MLKIFILAWPTMLAGFLYLFQSGINYKNGDYAMTITFFAYALANVGLIWAMIK